VAGDKGVTDLAFMSPVIVILLNPK
jgi:hypothetical protein